jgi:hypothetical protein
MKRSLLYSIYIASLVYIIQARVKIADYTALELPIVLEYLMNKMSSQTKKNYSSFPVCYHTYQISTLAAINKMQPRSE